MALKALPKTSKRPSVGRITRSSRCTRPCWPKPKQRVISALLFPLNMLWQSKKVHEMLYRQAAESFAQGKDLPAKEYYVCPVCGNTHEGPMEGRCPVCNTPGEKFEKIA